MVLVWPLCVHYELTAIIKTLVFVAPLKVASPRLCPRDAALSKFLIPRASERNVSLLSQKRSSKPWMCRAYSECISKLMSVNFKHWKHEIFQIYNYRYEINPLKSSLFTPLFGTNPSILKTNIYCKSKLFRHYFRSSLCKWEYFCTHLSEGVSGAECLPGT